jgi:hypothetical protein
MLLASNHLAATSAPASPLLGLRVEPSSSNSRCLTLVAHLVLHPFILRCKTFASSVSKQSGWKPKAGRVAVTRQPSSVEVGVRRVPRLVGRLSQVEGRKQRSRATREGQEGERRCLEKKKEQPTRGAFEKWSLTSTGLAFVATPSLTSFKLLSLRIILSFQLHRHPANEPSTAAPPSTLWGRPGGPLVRHSLRFSDCPPYVVRPRVSLVICSLPEPCLITTETTKPPFPHPSAPLPLLYLGSQHLTQLYKLYQTFWVT